MNKRDALEILLRAMAVYLIVDGLLRLVSAVSAVKSQAAILHSSGIGEGWVQILPGFAYPVASFFAGVILWRMTQGIALRAFPGMLQQGVAIDSVALQRVAGYLLSTYFIIAGTAGTVDFIVRAALGPRRVEFFDIGVTVPVWNDLAVTMAWLVAGVAIHIGFGRITGAVKRVGDSVADTLWRIKPEELSPTKEDDETRP